MFSLKIYQLTCARDKIWAKSP